MDGIGGKNRCERFKRKVPTVLKMHWRDGKNRCDCGVYLMRHLETYKGQDLKHWESGFKFESKNRIIPARIKYMHTLLCSPFNEKATSFKEEMQKFMQEIKFQRGTNNK